eukprot:IDg22111t1
MSLPPWLTDCTLRDRNDVLANLRKEKHRGMLEENEQITRTALKNRLRKKLYELPANDISPEAVLRLIAKGCKTEPDFLRVIFEGKHFIELKKMALDRSIRFRPLPRCSFA